jgi:serine/threonine-protein kinase RsbW
MAELRPASGGRTAIERAIDISTIAATRTVVERFARAYGLDGEALSDLILAANELTINVVRHGGGDGTLRMWYENGTVWCQVHDDGPGIPDAITQCCLRPDPPSRTMMHGRGLWLVHQMTASTMIDTGPAGTTVTIAARH